MPLSNGSCETVLSAPLEVEAIATLENEAAQTSRMGDLGGGPGADPAAGRGQGAAAAGGWPARQGTVDGGDAGPGGCAP